MYEDSFWFMLVRLREIDARSLVILREIDARSLVRLREIDASQRSASAGSLLSSSNIREDSSWPDYFYKVEKGVTCFMCDCKRP